MPLNRRRGLSLLLSLAAVLIQQKAVLTAQELRPFEAILWRHGGPPLSKAYADALKRAGVTAVCVDNGEDPAPVAKLGIRFYVDHTAGKGTLHLRQKEFQELWETYRKERSSKALVRPEPLLSFDVRKKLHKLVEERVKQALPHRPLMFSLEDEISMTRHETPLDFCFHASSLKAFRTWLRGQYGKIDQLNQSWERNYTSFTEVLPPTTDEVRRREPVNLFWPRNLADWNDFRSFNDDVLVETIGQLASLSKKLAPDVPVGIEGAQPPSTFAGLDYYRLLQKIDFIEAYDIGGMRELVRSFKKPGTLHFETVFPEKAGAPPQRALARVYDMLAHGLSGVIIWSSKAFFLQGDPRELSAYGKLLARELPVITGKKARVLRTARRDGGEIAILESQKSVRLNWMLDSARDGKTWLRRFGSYEREHSTSQAARLSWVRLLQDLGYPFHFVSSAQLERGALDRGGRKAKVLVLPSANAMSKDEIRGVLRFASKGGLVIADERGAHYDGGLRRRKLSALDPFFGVDQVRATRHLREGRVAATGARLASGVGIVETGLRPSGNTVAQRVGRNWCQFERSAGKGVAVLLNLAVSEYAAARLVPKKTLLCQELRRRIKFIFERQEIFPSAVVSVAGYPTIIERVWLDLGRGKKVLVVRANCLDDADLFDKLLKRGPVPMTLFLPFIAKVSDFWTGRELGIGRKIKLELDPLRGSFLNVEKM